MTHAKFVLTSLLCTYSLHAFSQTSTYARQSKEIIQKGVELHDEKKYEAALVEFRKVDRNDSNYYLAGAEILNSLIALEKNTEALELCNHLLKLKNDYTPNILNFKGDCLDNLGQREEALRVYKEGALAYPLNHSFYYEPGVVLLRQQKITEAYDQFVKTLRINPFHPASHFQMGLLAYRAKNMTAALLAFQFYLICDPSSERAKGIVVDLEKISKLEMEIDSAINIPHFQTENDFSELESVLRSKVALSKKFKAKTALKYELVNQIQLISENIGKYSDVKGFYSEFYGKFFAELEKNNLFEPFAYKILGGMKIEQVDKWREKNSEEIKKLNDWAYNYICKEFANYPPDVNDNKPPVPHWFSGNFIQSAGKMTPDGKNDGYWNFYYNNGIKRSEGEFKNGNRNGLWKFYRPDGSIKEESGYSDGNEITYKSYYSNSNPSVEIETENGKISGLRKAYYSNGNVASTTTYKDGKINGPQTYYFRSGAVRYVINNKEGMLSGDLVEYFDNGKKYQTVKLVNSTMEGPAKTFFNNDQNTLASAGEFIKGNKVGLWKEYYRTGTIYKEMTFNKDGLYEGEVKEYHENGKLSEVSKYSNGKQNDLGKTYNNDGTLWEELLYRKGKLLEYRAYKKTGEKLCDNKINGKNFRLTLFHPTGQKKREGAVSDGELTGTWNDYNMFGVLTQESNYVEGKLEGQVINYHTNGKVKNKKLYTQGQENGVRESFYINGAKESEGMIADGEYVGTWNFYYKDGKRKSTIYYVDSEVEGWSEHYSVSGMLQRESLNREFCLVKVIYHDTNGVVKQNIDLPGGTGLLEKKGLKDNIVYTKKFVKDYADGKSSTYFPDGKLETVAEYNKGKQYGKSLSYNPFGQMISEALYFNDEKNGAEKTYSNEGKLTANYVYVNGDLHGVSHIYHENGKLERNINYSWGDVDGESSMFDDSGELVYSRTFKSDFLESYTYKSNSGELLPPKILPGGEVKLTCFYQNGKKSIEASYLNGDLHGKRLIYHSNGKLVDESNFYYDFSHGESKEYYSTGALRNSENYFYGSLEGTSKEYFENGKLKTEKNYRNGTLHGWVKYYDATGKLLKSLYYYDGDPLTIK